MFQTIIARRRRATSSLPMLRWGDDQTRHAASAAVSPPVFLEQLMTDKRHASCKLNTATQSAPQERRCQCTFSPLPHPSQTMDKRSFASFS